MKHILKFISNNFWNGVIFLVPLLFAVYAAIWVFNLAEGLGNYLLKFIFENPVQGLGFAIFLIIVWFSGLLTHFKFLQNLFQKMPIINSVMGVANKAAEFRSLLKYPVLIENNETGELLLGFITGKTRIEGDIFLVKVLVFYAHFAGITKFYKPDKEVLIGFPQKEAIDLIISYGFFSNKNETAHKLKKVKLSEILEKIEEKN